MTKKLRFMNNLSKISNVKQSISILYKTQLLMTPKNNLTVIITIIHWESLKNIMILKVKEKNNLKRKISRNLNIKSKNGWSDTFIIILSTESVSKNLGLLLESPYKVRKTKINHNINILSLLIFHEKCLKSKKKKKLKKSLSTLKKSDTIFSLGSKKKKLWRN